MSWKSKSEEKRRMEKLYNLTGVSFWSGAFKNQYRNDTLRNGGAGIVIENTDEIKMNYLIAASIKRYLTYGGRYFK